MDDEIYIDDYKRVLKPNYGQHIDYKLKIAKEKNEIALFIRNNLT